MEDLTGLELGQYRIVAPLGEGGMAAVFKAYQPSMDRHVALKILPRQLASEPGFAARFGQEARLVAKLEHPNIVPVHDFGESKGYTFLVMRFVGSGTLADLLEKSRLPLDQVVRFVTQIGEALHYAHRQGVVHRDVKPSNVLMDPSGNCLLSDFGLARMVESSLHLTRTGGVLGTPAYMSPEQGLGEKLDARTDIYSLGVMLYEMATYRLPFVAETPVALMMKHLRDPLPLPRTLNPSLPESVERVILRSLAKNPNDRFGTAQAMVDALRGAPAATGEAGTLTTRSRPAEPAVPRRGEERPRPSEEPAAEADVALLQRHRYSKVQRTRESTFLLVALGLITPGGLMAPWALAHPEPNAQPPAVLPISMLILYVLFGVAAVRQWRKARRMEAQLRLDAARDGNHYCCRCGEPMRDYSWIHYVLCLLLPWGLIALAFKLRKCRQCGRPYPSRERA